MHSIRIKITAITIAAILTSILSVFIASNRTILANNDRSSVKMMNLICQTTQQSIGQYLDSIEQSVEMAAMLAYDTLDSVVLVENGAAGTSSELQTPEQKAVLDAYMADYCANIQEVFSSVASRTHGVVTYYYCISPGISENEHGFFYSRVGKTGFNEQEPLDARELDPYDIEHTTWFYTPIQRGRPSWVGPYPAHFLGEMQTCSYLVPIYKSGAFIGVLGMDIPFEILTDLVSDIRVYDTGYACLLDEEGRVLWHPTQEVGVVPAAAGISVSTESLQQKSSSDELIRYTLNGQKRQMAYTTLQNSMKLVISAPEKEINASTRRLVGIILIDAAVIIAVFSVLLMLVMGLITRPLQRLTAASQRLADGEYDVELGYNSRDEVGTLTRSFKQMRDHLQRYIGDLSRQVTTDTLTGLPNMRHFFELAEEQRTRLVETGEKPSLMYFNLVGMKYFNSQYGLDEGDSLIRGFADILLRHYGASCVGRIAQDHFAAVTGKEHPEEELEEIFRETAQLSGGKGVPVRVGIYPNELEVVRVNTACDRAKLASNLLRAYFSSGYRFFDRSMLEESEQVRYVITHFDQALAEHWIQVYYQPIIRAANGRVCDTEALSRWCDPERGMLSPGLFIPILENARLIYKLDLYVLEEILATILEQERLGMEIVPRSLNLSREDFDACDIVEEVRRRVDDAGVSRDKITIEVTESTVGSSFEFMKEQIGRFQALGFSVWMDDFGSGYSALDVLQDIRFDLIKFDMRFMQRFGEGDESRIILTELVKMAISLGFDTVCEGVETREQADFLREVGCTKLQGYYFCRPISSEQIMEQFAKGELIPSENAVETDYYTAIGRINLYDLSAVTSGGDKLGNFFEVVPMAIIEADGENVKIVRCNKTYRDFMVRAFGGLEVAKNVENTALENGPGAPFVQAVNQCREPDTRVFVREDLGGGKTIHSLIRHVAVNPATGIFSCLAVVLGISDEEDRF